MYSHQPVLLKEVLDALSLRSGAIVIDCTIGGGGHTQVILERIGLNGRVLGIDRDEAAIVQVQERFSVAIGSGQLVLAHGSFDQLSVLARNVGFDGVDAILFDLGASSHHFDTKERGFSFSDDGPLDMRYDQTSPVTAAHIINTKKEVELASIFYSNGEERLSRAIARAIIAARSVSPVIRTGELASIVEAVYRKHGVRDRHIHPATRVFQALRIAVNDEYAHIEHALPQALHLLKKGGRLAVITFHSGEERIIKRFYKQESRACLCPIEFPVCRCGHTPQLTIVTKKGIHASPEELLKNPRARSASLRVAEKI